MKLGVPWTVKGIRPETRETAKEAARRSGMPLGDWLNSVILHSADQGGAEPAADDDDIYGDTGLNEVHGRLDDITRRLEHLAKSGGPAAKVHGPDAYAPPRYRSEPDQLTALIERLDKRIETLANAARVAVSPQPIYAAPVYVPPPSMPVFAPPSMPPPPRPGNFAAGLDQAVAEISARRRALNGEAAPQPASAAAPAIAPAMAAAMAPAVAVAPPMAPALPTQDISGLEDQLRKITTQIETLRHPGVEEAISALRGELAEIGNSLSEAMPRQAIDTIERQIQGLSQRIAEGRQAGVDGDALVGIERGLAEVRDALGQLTPAESLIGFHEAVAGLAHKIDLIVAEKDPQTLQQLKGAITTLREISHHIASDETVGRLAQDVELLADKVERIANASANGDALGSLEQRITALADAVSARSENGTAVPPRLEALVESLAGKLEQVQLSRGDNVAVGHLEDRIVQLVEKLDASDSRLGNLEAVERGLADLLVHVEEMRAKKGEGGLRGATQNAGVDDLKQDIARTQDEIEAVHGTLGHVVERLAMIEQGIRGETPAQSTPVPPMPGRVAARVAEPPPLELTEDFVAEPSHLPPSPQLEAADIPPPPMAAPRLAQIAAPPLAPQLQPQRPAQRPAAKNPPINPDLPPDQPLEPGSGLPQLRRNPGARIAASEAALAGTDLPRAEAPAGKSGFIAAARRAAQKALADLPTRGRAHTSAELGFELPDEAASTPSLRTRIKQRLKSVFVSASVIAIVVGGVQVGSQYFRVAENGAPGGRAVQTAENERAAIQAGMNRADSSNPEITGAVNQPAALPGMLPPSSTYGISGAASGPAEASGLPQNALSSVPELNGKPAADLSDITGSVRAPATRRAAEPRQNAAPDVGGAKLPIAIGGPLLREAASRGDSAAAYEVAVRYAEGRGVPANLEESARWLERAAREGLVPAQFRLGSLYEKGQGVKKDLHKARELYVQAAGKGSAKAMHNLAVLYAEGIDGRPDYAAAAQWFRKAANHGISDSQYNLGILCARGLGTDKNFAESYKWFALAAAQGDKEAARKRDELIGRLDAKSLAAAQKAVTRWTAEPQPEAATAIPGPPQGWDPATSELPAGKPRQHSRGSFEIGRR